MSIVCERLTSFQKEAGYPTILLVHHTTKDGLNFRGSSVIPGHVDGMIGCSRFDKEGIKITCEGMRDAEDFEDIILDFESVLIETEDGVKPSRAIKGRRATGLEAFAQGVVNKNDDLVFTVLYELYPDGATFTDWCDSVKETHPEISRDAFNTSKKNLQSFGRVYPPPPATGSAPKGTKFYAATKTGVDMGEQLKVGLVGRTVGPLGGQTDPDPDQYRLMGRSADRSQTHTNQETNSDTNNSIIDDETVSRLRQTTKCGTKSSGTRN